MSHLARAAAEACDVLAGVDRYRPPRERCRIALDLLSEALAPQAPPPADPDQLSLLDL